MDKLQAMHIFTRVVETNSFSRAADAVHLPRASVTRIIQELESHLKARLLNRTTRSLSVTEQGALYYERCVKVLADIDAAEEDIAMTSHVPRGKIRVDMPGFIGKHIVLPALSVFRQRYPDIELVIGISDRYVDLVQEGVDCAIRIGELHDSTLIGRRIGASTLVVLASRDYFDRNGIPAKIADLPYHQVIGFVSSRTGRILNLSLSEDGKNTQFKPNVTLSTNEGDSYLQCALLGLGLVQIPMVLAKPHLESGELVEVLKEYRPQALPISLLYPQSRHLSPQVRAFIDWAVAHFEQHEASQPSESARSEKGRRPSRRTLKSPTGYHLA